MGFYFLACIHACTHTLSLSLKVAILRDSFNLNLAVGYMSPGTLCGGARPYFFL